MQSARRAAAPAILMVLPALFLIRAIGPGLTLSGSDLTLVFWHSREWVTQELLSGRLPTWDPHVMGGFPVLAANQAAILYPPTWISAILPAAVFWVVITWLHLAMAGWFAELWLRRGLALSRPAALLGAAVYSLSGFIYAHIDGGHVNYVWAYPWGAALLWRLERWLAKPTARRALLVATPPALMILAGVPQLAFIAGLVALARLAHVAIPRGEDRRMRSLKALAAVGLLASSFLLAAPQVLPTMELSREAQRSASTDPVFMTGYSMPPENLVLLAAPTAAGDGVTTPYWGRWNLVETCGYVGLATLLLAAIGASGSHSQRRLWVVVGVVALFLAMGRYTPIFRIFSAVVPGAGLFRGPGRYLFAFTLAASALAALGWDRLRAERTGMAVTIGAFLMAALLAAGALWAGTKDEASWKDFLMKRLELRHADVPDVPKVTPDGTRSTARWALGAGAGVALLAGALLAAHSKGWAPPPTIALLFGLLIATELVVFSQRFVRPQSTESLDWPPEAVDYFRRQPGSPFRIATIGTPNVADTGRCRVAGLDHVGGYEPLLLRRYAELMNLLVNRPPEHPFVVALPFRPHPILAMLGARFWIVPAEVTLPPEFRRKAQLNDRYLYDVETGLPRAWLASKAVSIPDRDRRLRALMAKDWDPRTTVILEAEVGPDGGDGDVVLQSRSPGAYRFDVRSPSGGWVVLSESWYPGWAAFVDGAPALLLPANHMVQAVRGPPGSHDVRFEYRSRTLVPGFALSALTLAGFGVAAWRGRRRIRPT